MRSYISPDSAVKHLQPENPVVIFRPHALKKATEMFLSRFNGTVLYAVKTNPDEHVLKSLWAAGVRHFDVASLHEVSLARGLFPEASLYFMHTVKSRQAIRKAYFDYGVRHFSLDCAAELAKIVEETSRDGVPADDLALFVRVGVSNQSAQIELSGKFGASVADMPELLKSTRSVAKTLGVCFHVGSQCMDPQAYRTALKLVQNLVNGAGVKLDVLDVGGGFPSIYPGMEPPALSQYFDAIHQAAAPLLKKHGCQLMCEPGRALVAESGAVIARVEMRKGNYLYLNDGTYGSLFDAGVPKFIFPTRRLGANTGAKLAPFSFYGPTCDSLDTMAGPFLLPEDIREGDYIEIGQLGAYGRTMATRFNGFALSNQTVAVKDEPMMSLYGAEPVVEQVPLRVARG